MIRKITHNYSDSVKAVFNSDELMHQLHEALKTWVSDSFPWDYEDIWRLDGVNDNIIEECDLLDIECGSSSYTITYEVTERHFNYSDEEIDEDLKKDIVDECETVFNFLSTLYDDLPEYVMDIYNHPGTDDYAYDYTDFFGVPEIDTSDIF